MDGSSWRTRVWRIGGAALLLASSAGGAAAQVLQGHLVDSSTREPIEAATISLLADSATVAAVATDSAGYFSLAGSQPGEYRLRAQRIGYPPHLSSPLSLGEGDTLQVEFRISAGAVLLDPVVVTGRRRPPPPDIVAFYERAEASIFGTFFTRAEIERLHPFWASDLLRRVPGIQLVPRTLGGGSIARIRGCTPMVVVDGVEVRYVQSIDDLVAPQDLEGLEVYRSASQVPVQYGGLRGTCGAILIWTRRGP